MKRPLVVLLASLMLAAASAPVSLVQNEYNFAATVARKGINEGFLMYLDKQAIGFAPGPVKSYEGYSKRKPSNSKLDWYPAYALVASSGDFGVDTGPWTATWVKDGKTQQAHGEWLTIWARDKDGKWKALFDSGTGHEPGSTEKALKRHATVAQLPVASGPVPAVDDVHDQLVRAETMFSNEASDKSLRSAYLTSGADELRLLLDKSQPILGRDLATRVAPDMPSGLDWVPMGGSAARSGDLGYIYGETYKLSDTKHVTPQGVYMHVWRRGADGWKLLIALDTPI